MERDSRCFLLLTQLFVIALVALQIGLCLQQEWGGGFSTSDFSSIQFFNFHPLLNILAFGVAMTESLLSFKGFGMERGAAKTLHACLQLASVLLGVLAFTVVVVYHNSNAFPNFYSVHSWIGMAVYVLAWFQFTASLFIFWLPGFAPVSLKVAFLRYHKIGGLAIYFAAMMAVATGLMQKQSFLRNNPNVPLFGRANLLANATAILAAFVSLGVLGVLGFDRAAGHRVSREATAASTASNIPLGKDPPVPKAHVRNRTPSGTAVRVGAAPSNAH